MAISEDGYFVCDFCGYDTGKFNSETGNHRACEKYEAALAARDAENLAMQEKLEGATRIYNEVMEKRDNENQALREKLEAAKLAMEYAEKEANTVRGITPHTGEAAALRRALDYVEMILAPALAALEQEQKGTE